MPLTSLATNSSHLFLLMMPRHEARCGLPRIPLLRLSEKGTSNAPIVDLAGMRRPKWVKRPLFGGPWGYAAGESETFRTVSLRRWVNKTPASRVTVALSVFGMYVTIQRTSSPRRQADGRTTVSMREEASTVGRALVGRRAVPMDVLR